MKGHHAHNRKFVIDSHSVVSVNTTSVCESNRSNILASELCQRKYKRASTAGPRYQREKPQIDFPELSTYSMKALSSDRQASDKFSPNAECLDFYGIYNTMNYLERSGKYAARDKSSLSNVNGNRPKSGKETTRKMVKSVFPKYPEFDHKSRATQLAMRRVMENLNEEGKEFATLRNNIEGMVSYNGSLNAEAVQRAGSSSSSMWGKMKSPSVSRRASISGGMENSRGLLSRTKSQINMSSGVIAESPSNKARPPPPKRAVSFFDKVNAGLMT